MFCRQGYKAVTFFCRVVTEEKPAAMNVSGRTFGPGMDYRLCVFHEIKDYRLSRCLLRQKNFLNRGVIFRKKIFFKKKFFIPWQKNFLNAFLFSENEKKRKADQLFSFFIL